MIRINLLPEKRKKRRHNLLLIIVAVNLAAIILAAAATLWVNGEVGRLREESGANKTAIETLKSKVREMHEIQVKNRILEERSALIDALRRNQSVPVRVLDEVSTLIPDGVWLSSLAFKDDVVNLEGNAFSNIEIVSFMDHLKKAADLADVYLDESREGEIDKVKIYHFRAHFRVQL